MSDKTSHPIVLEVKGLTRRFPGVLALNQVDLDVRVGEVHALVGENGAGKSTLMKIIAGLEKPAEIIVDHWGVPHPKPSHRSLR